MRPIPPRILRTTVTVRTVTGLNLYQKPEYAETTVSRVHVQSTNELRRTAENTDVALRSLLFADARISKPALDYGALFRESAKIGAPMQVVACGETYTVVSVDRLKSDTDRMHHWEIGLV